jgi:acyl-CoA reductase-like NAD-dependent aldehyde dehydrogenase
MALDLTVSGMTIGGLSVGSDTVFGVVDPSTGEVFAEAPDCSPEQLDAAFAAAAAASTAWAADDAGRRAALLELADRIEAARPELGAILSAETGKPTPLAERETQSGAAWLRHFAGVEIPRTVLQDDDNALIEVAYKPLGVVAAIVPWNFPLSSVLTGKLAPALRAGNTVVVKPSPFTPLATLRLGEILAEILPPGVVNVVTGGDELGVAITRHPVPRKVAFTGSIEAGKAVASAAGADLKRVTLELGGNDAAVLLDDVEPRAVARAVLSRAFYNVGQTCAVPKRIYAPAGLFDEIVSAFADEAAGYVLGTDLGPLSTRPQYERVCELVAEALAGGATAVTGGRPVDGPGFFFEPTIVTGATDDMRIVAEEQFGPALPILPYDDVDEAIERANATMYGLCGSVWSSDFGRARETATRLECGVTYVNSHGIHQPSIPMRGTKWSGVGVEHGLEGLLELTEKQVVYATRRAGGGWPPPE